MPKLNLMDNPHKMPLIEVTINKKPHRFLVDTGASHSVFSPLLVEDMTMKPIGAAEAVGVNGAVLALTMPIRFNFCGISLDKIDVLPNLPPGTSGLIGQDVLQKFSIVEFDNRERTLRLIP